MAEIASKPADTQNHQNDVEEAAPLFAKVVATIGGLFLFAICVLVFFWIIPQEHGLLSYVICQHFLAVTGLPVSAFGATLVVATFRVTAGPIEFKALGFEFSGASGPVVLWVLCFLASVAAVRVLWSAT
jgi:hypothetical protein